MGMLATGCWFPAPCPSRAGGEASRRGARCRQQSPGGGTGDLPSSLRSMKGREGQRGMESLQKVARLENCAFSPLLLKHQLHTGEKLHVPHPPKKPYIYILESGVCSWKDLGLTNHLVNTGQNHRRPLPPREAGCHHIKHTEKLGGRWGRGDIGSSVRCGREGRAARPPWTTVWRVLRRSDMKLPEDPHPSSENISQRTERGNMTRYLHTRVRSGPRPPAGVGLSTRRPRTNHGPAEHGVQPPCSVTEPWKGGTC